MTAPDVAALAMAPRRSTPDWRRSMDERRYAVSKHYGRMFDRVFRCKTCRGEAYRPDAVTMRLPALRCSGCHRTTGNCNCRLVVVDA